VHTDMQDLVHSMPMCLHVRARIPMHPYSYRCMDLRSCMTIHVCECLCVCVCDFACVYVFTCAALWGHTKQTSALQGRLGGALWSPTKQSCGASRRCFVRPRAAASWGLWRTTKLPDRL